jgi:hypothetical protein
MDIFAKIGSLLDEKPSESIMDDNVAIAADNNNPYLSTVVLGARNAYDTLHALMAPLIKGKKSSLKQIDKWLDNWVRRLESIEKMYKELLAKLNDLGADFTGTFNIEFAKEAWEIVQDTPILRRYMGEANYWLLYDTVGLLATQSGSLSGDLLAGVKSAIKQAILALISMTDGLLCLESYLGMIQQYWGALYLKITPLPLLDSIVPNVTCAYWYKPAISSQSNGTTAAITLRNDPPGHGFTPIPLPVPNPTMYVKDPTYIGKIDYQNPDTWYLDGAPYYLPNTMNLLERALQYWGSSYTNEFLPAVNNIYPRREYGEGGAHPLRAGHTFAQLDTSKMSISGTNVATKVDNESTVDEIFSEVFTKDILRYMTSDTWTVEGITYYGWQKAYELAYNLIAEFILSGFSAYGEKPSTITRFFALQQGDPTGAVYPQFSTWYASNVNFKKALIHMNMSWKMMVNTYGAKVGIPVGDSRYHTFFDAIMKAFVDAGHTVGGYKGSLETSETFMVSPSFCPVTAFRSEEENMKAGVPFIAYKVDTTDNRITYISSGQDTTAEGDAVNVTYNVKNIAFVMGPSEDIENDMFTVRTSVFSIVADSILAAMTNVATGLHKATPSIKYTQVGLPYIIGYSGGNAVNSDAMVTTQYYEHDSTHMASVPLGILPEALYMHRSAIDNIPKFIDKEKTQFYLGNIFFPDGKVPTSLDEAKTPETFVTHYLSFYKSAKSANQELADIVGYSIDHGRETKFPCFGVYGELLSMQSWHYTEMPYLEFSSKYAKVKSGSNLYYELSNPEHIIFYHSSYVSQTRQMQMAVIHEYLESTVKSYGANDKYTFYVFPTESISVSKLSSSPSLGSFLSVDATSPSGDAYHYITLRNPIPKCAKYVDSEKWSIMDIIHELYLLATNLAGLCGDNGERLKSLQDDLSEFHISTPQFIGQLPENNGQYSPFRFEIFKDYSDKIEKLVNSIYNFRAEIVAATEAW